MLCWDGKCAEGIGLCCKWCDKKETCGDPCDDTKCMEEKSMSEKMRWLYIGNKVVDGNVLEVYRCSKCCCLIHVEKGEGLPNECPDCGEKSFDEEAKTKIDWILTKEAKPTKSGDYLCWTRYGAMVLPFSVKYNAFNTRDSYEETGSDLEVKAWALPIEEPVEE